MTKRFSEMTIIYTSIQMVEQINWRSSPTARMTKLIMSDETLEERVIAIGKKRHLHPVFYQRDVPIECGTPWKFPVDVMQRVLRTMTTMCRGMPYC